MSATASLSKVSITAHDTYTIEIVNPKGNGMIAAKDLNPGDVIVVEEPLLIVDAPIGFRDIATYERAVYEGTVYEGAIYKRYLELSKEYRERFKDLTYHATSEEITEYSKRCGKQHDKERGRIIARFFTNCMEDSMSSKRYVGAACARINHSCDPNIHYDYFHDSNVIVVRAVRKIARGDEIYNSYVPPLWVKDRRQDRLWKEYGFKCDCKVCNGRPLISDKVSIAMERANDQLIGIRERARRAGVELGSVDTVGQIQLCSMFVERSLSIKALIPQTFAMLKVYVRCLELAKRSDTTEAKKWYGEAYRLGLICYGPDDFFVKHCAHMLQSFPGAV